MAEYTNGTGAEPFKLVLHERVEPVYGTGKATFPLQEMARFPWAERSLVFLGGSETCSPGIANGYAKRMRTMLTGEGANGHTNSLNKVRIFSVVYPAARFEPARAVLQDTSTARSEDAQNERYQICRQMAEQLTEELFAPRIAEACKSRKPLQSLMEDFRHLTLFGHSFGSHLVPHIHAILQNKLHETGFSTKDTKKILRQIHVMTAGETGVWYLTPKDGVNFTVLYAASPNDFFIKETAGITANNLNLVTLASRSQNGMLVEPLKPLSFDTDTNPALQSIAPGRLQAMQKLHSAFPLKTATHHIDTYVGMEGMGSTSASLMPKQMAAALQKMVLRGRYPMSRIQNVLGSMLPIPATRLPAWPKDWGALELGNGHQNGTSAY